MRRAGAFRVGRPTGAGGREHSSYLKGSTPCQHEAIRPWTTCPCDPGAHHNSVQNDTHDATPPVTLWHPPPCHPVARAVSHVPGRLADGRCEAGDARVDPQHTAHPEQAGDPPTRLAVVAGSRPRQAARSAAACVCDGTGCVCVGSG